MAEKLGDPRYRNLSLDDEFAEAIDAMRHCLTIRNQFAHCNWWDDNSGRLAFANLEDLARQSMVVPDLRTLAPKYVDVPLLASQEAYFNYADELLGYVNYEGRFRAGTIASRPFPKPPNLTKPPLSIP